MYNFARILDTDKLGGEETNCSLCEPRNDRYFVIFQDEDDFDSSGSTSLDYISHAFLGKIVL